MRFVKLTDTKLRKDIVHVWIEDDCDEQLQRMLVALLKNEGIIDERMGIRQRYVLSDRFYDKRESKGKQMTASERERSELSEV